MGRSFDALRNPRICDDGVHPVLDINEGIVYRSWTDGMTSLYNKGSKMSRKIASQRIMELGKIGNLWTSSVLVHSLAGDLSEGPSVGRCSTITSMLQLGTSRANISWFLAKIRLEVIEKRRSYEGSRIRGIFTWTL